MIKDLAQFLETAETHASEIGAVGDLEGVGETSDIVYQLSKDILTLKMYFSSESNFSLLNTMYTRHPAVYIPSDGGNDLTTADGVLKEYRDVGRTLLEKVTLLTNIRRGSKEALKDSNGFRLESERLLKQSFNMAIANSKRTGMDLGINLDSLSFGDSNDSRVDLKDLRYERYLKNDVGNIDDVTNIAYSNVWYDGGGYMLKHLGQGLIHITENDNEKHSIVIVPVSSDKPKETVIDVMLVEHRTAREVVKDVTNEADAVKEIYERLQHDSGTRHFEERYYESIRQDISVTDPNTGSHVKMDATVVFEEVDKFERIIAERYSEIKDFHTEGSVLLSQDTSRNEIVLKNIERELEFYYKLMENQIKEQSPHLMILPSVISTVKVIREQQ